jgi:hypothetical protein
LLGETVGAATVLAKLDQVELSGFDAEVAEEGAAAAEQDVHEVDHHLVDEAGAQALLGDIGAKEQHVRIAGGTTPGSTCRR